MRDTQEIDRQIKVLDDKWWAIFEDGRKVTEAGEFEEPTVAHQRAAVMAEIEREKGLLQAKQVNLRAGLPENFALQPDETKVEMDKLRSEIAAVRKASLKLTQLDTLLERVAVGVHNFVDESLAPIIERLDQLAAKVDANAGVSYEGVWDQGKKYMRGQFVTQSGSVWHCERESTGARPGDGPDWVLAVKRGADR